MNLTFPEHPDITTKHVPGNVYRTTHGTYHCLIGVNTSRYGFPRAIVLTFNEVGEATNTQIYGLSYLDHLRCVGNAGVLSFCRHQQEMDVTDLKKVSLPPPRTVALDLAVGHDGIPKLRAVLDWEGDAAKEAHQLLASIVLSGGDRG